MADATHPALAAIEDLLLGVDGKPVGSTAFGTWTRPLLFPGESYAAAEDLLLDPNRLGTPNLMLEIVHRAIRSRAIKMGRLREC
jgi:hypothetical protein